MWNSRAWSASIKPSDTLAVAISVAGTGSATPTGTVTLSSGTFSASGSLSGGNTTLSIPANTLTAGQANTLTANYSGDSHYLAGVLLGKTSKKAEAHVCVEATVEVAQAGSHGLTPAAK